MPALAVLGAALALTSPAFHTGGTIPARYTCSGANVSPPLRWTAGPRATRSFSVTMVDVTVGFLHWQALSIPASVHSLPRNAHLRREGVNSFGKVGYGGPCPPPGRPHRYVFTVRAHAPGGRVLAEATLVGLYGR